MSGRQVTQKVKFEFDGEIKGLRNSISEIQKQMSQIKMPQGSTTAINKDLEVLINKLKELEVKNKDGFIDLGDASSINKISKKITEIFNSLATEMKNLDSLSDKLLPPETLKKFKDLERSIEGSKNKLSNIAKIEKKIDDAKATRSTKGYNLDRESRKTIISDDDYNNLKNFESAKKRYKKIQDSAKVNGKVDKRKYTKTDKEEIAEYERLKKVIEDAGYSSEKLAQTLKNVTTQSKISKLKNEFEAVDNHIKELEQNLKDVQNVTGSLSLDGLKKQAAEIGVNIEGVNSIEELQNKINNFKTEQITNAKQEFEGLAKEITDGGKQAEDLDKKVTGEMNQVVDSTKKASDEFEQFSNRLQYFFGLTNGIQLFKRALREAFNSVKELDAAMKEIAVVSEYSIGDMWSSLPQFTKQANELGSTITDVYNATGLYVQQGLDLVESQGLANETLKMAKIAGMDAAAATDAMTSALRGFNMELNEGSAQKVNDIYSQLAAITASDTQEIATAMSKTASIANNAGASIENTAAFLSQIIETTRESAETAGTALKTVIARFSELKKNPAEIGSVDGEIVDANQIESALRLANVDLRDANGQFRNFDEVIIELSGQWDNLDKNTQRYIATMAAGSRQQSRFLALMSDNERLLQLTDAAYNSAGASTTQFNKTLESLDSKLNALNNAWDSFTQNLANNQLIKNGIDLLTELLNAINNILSLSSFGASGTIWSSFFSIGVLSAILMMAKKYVTKGLSWIKQKIGSEISDAGKTAGVNAGENIGKNLIERLTPYVEKAEKMIAEVDKKTIENKKTEKTTKKQKKNKNKKSNNQNIASGDNNNNAEINKKDKEKNKNETEQTTEEIQKQNAEIAKTDKGTKKWGESITQNTQTIHKWGSAITIAGMACGFLSQSLRESGFDDAANGVEHLGTALTAIGSVIYMLPTIVEAASSKIGKSLMKNMGYIVAIIAVVMVLYNCFVAIKEHFEKTDINARLKKATKLTEQAAAAAQKAQQAYSEWLSNKNEYSGLVEELERLTEGTEAWENKLNEVQDKMYELLELYPQLGAYVENGQITEQGLAYTEELIKQQQQTARNNSLISNIRKEEVNYEKQILELRKLQNETTEQAEKDAIDKRIELLEKQHKNIQKGNWSLVANEDSVRDDYKDLLAEVWGDKGKEKEIERLAREQDKIDVAGNKALAGSAAAIGGGIATIIAAVASGPVGWVALAAGVVAIAATEITGAISDNKEKEELKKTLAALNDLEDTEDLSKIYSEDILNDSEALAQAISSKITEQNYNDWLRNTSAELATMGNDVQRVIQGDFSIFDEIDNFGGWLEGLRDTISSDAFLALEIRGKQLNSEIKKTGDYLTKAFNNKIVIRNLEYTQGALTITTESATEYVKALQQISAIHGAGIEQAFNTVTELAIDNGESFEYLTDEINSFANATSRAAQAAKLKEWAESGNQALSTAAYSIKELKGDYYSATNQIKEFYSNLSSDQLNELAKDGKVTTASLMQAKDGLKDIDNIVDTTNISLTTMAKLMTDLGDGSKTLDMLKNNFVEVLDVLNKTVNTLEDSIAKAESFEANKSSTIVGTKIGEITKYLTDTIEKGSYGDTAVGSYFDYLFGEGAWDEALKVAKGDAEMALKNYQGWFSTLSEDTNYKDIWLQFANKSKYFSLNDKGGITFDLTGVTGYEDLANKIAEELKLPLELVKDMLSDAQSYSGELTSQLKNLDAAAGLNEYLSGIIDLESGTAQLDKQQIKGLFNDVFKDFFKTEEELTSFLENKIQNIDSNLEIIKTDSSISDTTASEVLVNSINKNENDFKQIALRTDGLSDKIYDGNDSQGYALQKKEDYEKYVLEELREQARERWLKHDFLVSSDLGTALNLTEKELIQNEEDIKKQIAAQINSMSLKDFGVTIQEGNILNGPASGTNTFFEGMSISVGKKATNLEDEFTKAAQETFDNLIAKGYSYEAAMELTQNEYSVDKLKESGVSTDEATRIYNELFDEDSLYNTIDYQLTEEEKQNRILAENIVGGIWSALEIATRRVTDAVIDSSMMSVADKEAARGSAHQGLGKYSGLGTKIIDNQSSSDNASSTTKDKEVKVVTTEELLALQSQNFGANTSQKIKIDAYEISSSVEQQHKEIDFDWLYNLNQLGEKAVRELQKLEKEYTLSLKNSTATSESIAENLASQYANIEMERRVSAAKAEHAQTRLNNFIQNEGNKELVDNYVNYDEKTGAARINWDALYEASKAGKVDELEKAEKLLQEIENDSKIIQEHEQLDLEKQQQQIELLEKIDSIIIDFESQVRDMIISQYEKEIDELSQIDSSINDANSKLITSIQNSLNRSRQERDNAKTEQNIANMQNRLALLRADTTGANRQEIAELEQQLGEAQEDYTDTLIDQKISQLQEQNEEASQQRQEQIAIAKDQLDSALENGQINEKVQKILEASRDFNDPNNPLLALWNNVKSEKGLSGTEWAKDLNAFKEKAVEYYGAKTFSDEYTNGDKSINADMAAKIEETLKKEDLNLSNLDIENAVTGMKILSANEIKTAIAEAITSAEEIAKKVNDPFKNYQKGQFGNTQTMDSGVYHETDWEVKTVQGTTFIKLLDNDGWVKQQDLVSYSTALGTRWAIKENAMIYKFATGGLNTYTGPAWLDGTPSKPELVLNATDTENFLQLKDILASIMNGTAFNTTTQKDGDINLEIYLNVEQGISSDYDVEQLVTKVKQEIARVGRERNIQILTKR